MNGDKNIKESQAGVIGDNAEVKGDIKIGDEISADGRDIVIAKEEGTAAIIKENSVVINNITIFHSHTDAQTQEPESAKEDIGPNPYVGLGAFQEKDAGRFFGREELTQKLWGKFREICSDNNIHLLPILGPSGSGKSSIARAGLIPKLAINPLPGYDKVRVAVMTPGTAPVQSLAGILARIVTGNIVPIEEAIKFEKIMKERCDEKEYDGLLRIVRLFPEINTSPLIILVDQFEEVYAQCKDKKEQDCFIQNLLYAASDASKYVSVILTLRSDFLGETQNNEILNRAIASNGEIIPAMNEEELRKAIAKPAENAGRALDDAVIDILVKDTKGREGALPLLQFALTRIWDGINKGNKPVDTLRQIGGVGGALAGEAQRLYDSLKEEEKAVARRAFLGMVSLGEGTKDTRRRVAVDHVVGSSEDVNRVKKVLEKFSDRSARLVTLSVEDIGSSSQTIEVTHEALLDHWGLLKNWIGESRDDLRFYRRLEESAIHWEKNKRSIGLLWRPPDLTLLRRFYTRKRLDFSKIQDDFYRASEKYLKIKKRTIFLSTALIIIIIGIVTIKINEARQEAILNYATTNANLAGMLWRDGLKAQATAKMAYAALQIPPPYKLYLSRLSLLMGHQLLSLKEALSEVKPSEPILTWRGSSYIFSESELKKIAPWTTCLASVTPSGESILLIGYDGRILLYDLVKQEISIEETSCIDDVCGVFYDTTGKYAYIPGMKHGATGGGTYPCEILINLATNNVYSEYQNGLPNLPYIPDVECSENFNGFSKYYDSGDYDSKKWETYNASFSPHTLAFPNGKINKNDKLIRSIADKEKVGFVEYFLEDYENVPQDIQKLIEASSLDTVYEVWNKGNGKFIIDTVIGNALRSDFICIITNKMEWPVCRSWDVSNYESGYFPYLPVFSKNMKYISIVDPPDSRKGGFLVFETNNLIEMTMDIRPSNWTAIDSDFNYAETKVAFLDSYDIWIYSKTPKKSTPDWVRSAVIKQSEELGEFLSLRFSSNEILTTLSIKVDSLKNEIDSTARNNISDKLNKRFIISAFNANSAIQLWSVELPEELTINLKETDESEFPPYYPRINCNFATSLVDNLIAIVLGNHLILYNSEFGIYIGATDLSNYINDEILNPKHFDNHDYLLSRFYFEFVSDVSDCEPPCLLAFNKYFKLFPDLTYDAITEKKLLALTEKTMILSKDGKTSIFDLNFE